MEWWERTDDYVSEEVNPDLKNRLAGYKMGKEKGFQQGYGAGKTVGTIKGAAGTAAAAGAAYGAYKAGKWAYNKLRGKNNQADASGAGAQECGTNCESASWVNDPGALSIMEGYFSEFADADIKAPEPQPKNEWDA